MTLPQDPIILFSFVNTRLRDQYPSLKALCEDFGCAPQALCDTLAALGYRYDSAQNQFI